MTQSSGKTLFAYNSTPQGEGVPGGWQSPSAQLLVREGDVIEVSVSSSAYLLSGTTVSWHICTTGALTPIAPGSGSLSFPPGSSQAWCAISGLGLYSASQTGPVSFWFQCDSGAYLSPLSVIATVVGDAVGNPSKVPGGLASIAAATTSGPVSLATNWTSSPVTLPSVDIGNVIQVMASWDLQGGALSWSIQPTTPGLTALCSTTNNAQGATGTSYNQAITALFTYTGQSSGPASFAIQAQNFGNVPASGQLSNLLLTAMVISKS